MATSERRMRGQMAENWNLLQEGITKFINNLEAPNQQPATPQEQLEEWIMLCSTAYRMSHDNQKAEEMYRRYSEWFEYYMTSVVLPALRSKEREFLLKEFVKRRNNHKVLDGCLSDVFMYYNSLYCHGVPWSQLPPPTPLCKLGELYFCKLVYDEIKSNVKHAVLALINAERDGEKVDRALLRNVVDIFLDIGNDCFIKDFESALMEDSKIYCSKKAALWISEYSCPEYMIKVEKCLKEEKERATLCLHSSSEEKLMKTLNKELISNYKWELLHNEHSGLHVLLKDGKVDDLSRMYRLFYWASEGLELMADIFEEHVGSEGLACVKEVDEACGVRATAREAQVFLRKVIGLYDKYYLSYVISCFMNHKLFQRAWNEACVAFCNKEIGKRTSAKLFAMFCDSILRKGADADGEGALEKVVMLLEYVNDKDVFLEMYKILFGDRLLMDSNRGLDHERSVIVKLKQKFGHNFTFKMEGMLNDIAVARTDKGDFAEIAADLHGKGHAHGKFDFSMTVLTSAHWQNCKAYDLKLPDEVIRSVDFYIQFYKTRRENRRLTLIHSLGICKLKGQFDSKQIEIVVTPCQAALLLLFNDSDKLCYSEIKSQLNLVCDEIVVKLLSSVSCAKYKILNKRPVTAKVEKTDYFEFNSKFSDKRRKIDIALAAADLRIASVTRKVKENVDKQRCYLMEAAIVRIMKTRKTLTFSNLIAECVQQLQKMFTPNIPDIKMRVEDLIQREFIERDNDDSQLFRYVA